MRDLIGLIDAILDVYDRPSLQPLPDGTTFCNMAVYSVAEALGCTSLTGKTADDILAFIEASPDWSDVPMEKVQDMTNLGSFIVGGLDSKSLDSAHGHVVVARPGIQCYSGKWGKVPRVLNIGRENFIARAKNGPLQGQPAGVNEAFIQMPKFYVWRPSLGF